MSSSVANTNSLGVSQVNIQLIFRPFMFTLYVRDVSLFVKSKVLNFADGTETFRAISCDIDCFTQQSDLALFSERCTINSFPLKVLKCSVICQFRKHSLTRFCYSIEKNSIPGDEVMSDLGVIFKSKLKFEVHINCILSKANSTLGFTKIQSKECDDPFTTYHLYCDLMRPILEYATPVRDPFLCSTTNTFR